MAVLNGSYPILLEENVILDWSDVVPQVWKYKELNPHNFSQIPRQAADALNRMMFFLERGYKSTLFDFKVVELKAGECGCKLPDWHMDVTRNPNHPARLCQHIIYTTEIGTEFMLDKVDTDMVDFADVKLPSNPLVWQAPAKSIVQFNRLNMHRGPIVPKDCKRVLIRITQTDII